jgi:MFS family permease
MRETSIPANLSPSLAVAGAPAAHALWTPAFLRLLVAGSTYGFAFSSFHLMPKVLAVEYSASPSEIGWVAGVFGAASVVTSAIVGSCIDRVSRRRLFAGSAFLLAATSIGFATMTELGPFTYVLRALQGVAFTMQMASFSTLVAELAPPSRLGEAVGLAGSSMLVMNAVAPAVDEPLARAAGWPVVFVLAAVAALVSAALVLETSSDRRAAGVPAPAGPTTLRAVFARPLTRAYSLVTLLTAIAFAAMFTFLQPAALAAGYRDVGPFFIAFATAACGVRVFAGRLPDRYGRKRVAVAALVPYVLATAWVAVAGPTSLLGIGAVFGLAHGVFFPSMNALAIEHTRPSERGRLLTIFAGAFNLGAWGGAAALGPVVEKAGYGSVFGIGALSAAAALLLLASTPGPVRASQAAPG